MMDDPMYDECYVAHLVVVEGITKSQVTSSRFEHQQHLDAMMAYVDSLGDQCAFEIARATVTPEHDGSLQDNVNANLEPYASRRRNGMTIKPEQLTFDY